MSDNISCPNCQTLISLNTEEFLKGKSFPCPNCEVKIGRSEKTDLDQDKIDVFKKFVQLKKEKSSVIPCPDCGSPISFLSKDLLKGKKAVCSNCQTSVAFQA